MYQRYLRKKQRDLMLIEVKAQASYWCICHRNIKSFHCTTEIPMIKVATLNSHIYSPSFIFLLTWDILSPRKCLEKKKAMQWAMMTLFTCVTSWTTTNFKFESFKARLVAKRYYNQKEGLNHHDTLFTISLKCGREKHAPLQHLISGLSIRWMPTMLSCKMIFLRWPTWLYLRVITDWRRTSCIGF